MSTQPEEMKDEEIEEGEILTDEVDVASLMTSLLATEDGDTVCTALVAISQQLQTQNRILIKILTELKA
jgi:DNA-binding IscR family transcriptional regulator